jgi:hypothetical protein
MYLTPDAVRNFTKYIFDGGLALAITTARLRAMLLLRDDHALTHRRH